MQNCKPLCLHINHSFQWATGYFRFSTEIHSQKRFPAANMTMDLNKLCRMDIITKL